MEEDGLDQIVRDGCSVGFYGPKSTYRKRIQSLIDRSNEEAEQKLINKLIKELPDAVFIPDNATAEANALGVGLAQYRLKVQQLLISKLK